MAHTQLALHATRMRYLPSDVEIGARKEFSFAAGVFRLIYSLARKVRTGLTGTPLHIKDSVSSAGYRSFSFERWF